MSTRLKALPTLHARMRQDERKGLFDFSWPVRSQETKQYISSLLGRQIKGHEGINETFKEAEDHLHNLEIYKVG